MKQNTDNLNVILLMK